MNPIHIITEPTLEPVGYSYWPILSHHPDGERLLLFLNLQRSKGGPGPTLFYLVKATNEVVKVGPLFTNMDRLSYSNCEQWYWSASRPTCIYIPDWTRLLRYDTVTAKTEIVLDVSDQPVPSSGRTLVQCHSSVDDRMHSMTIQNATYDRIGSAVYDEVERKLHWFPAQRSLDECQIDKSGQWLMIIEANKDGTNEDNRIIDLTTGKERVILDKDGAAGHHDLGFGQMICHSNFDNAWGLFDLKTLTRRVVYRVPTWERFEPSHLSWVNAPGAPVGYTKGGDETIILPLDGREPTKILTPDIVHGNVDHTGKYFIWTTLSNEAWITMLPIPTVSKPESQPERRSGRDRRVSVSSGGDTRGMRHCVRNKTLTTPS